MALYVLDQHGQQLVVLNNNPNRNNEPLPNNHESARDRMAFELSPTNSPPDFDIQSDVLVQHENYTKRIITSHASTHDETLRRRFIKAQTQRALEPTVRIRGESKGSYDSDGSEQYGSFVDFDIVIPVKELIDDETPAVRLVSNARKVYRGTGRKLDALGGDEEAQRSYPLRYWCREFCKYRRGPKRFTFERNIAESAHEIIPTKATMKTTWDVKYQGKIEVTFEYQREKVTLRSDHRMGQIRDDGVLWFLCCVFQLWIFFWLLSKRWEVLHIDWSIKLSPCASNGNGADDLANAWFEKWRLPIARAALNRLRERLESPVFRRSGAAWKPLGDLDEVQEWGYYNEGSQMGLNVHVAFRS